MSRDLKVSFHVITYQERRPFSLWSLPSQFDATIEKSLVIDEGLVIDEEVQKAVQTAVDREKEAAAHALAEVKAAYKRVHA